MRDLTLQEARPPYVLFCEIPTCNNLEVCDQCQEGSYHNQGQQSAQNIALIFPAATKLTFTFSLSFSHGTLQHLSLLFFFQ